MLTSGESVPIRYPSGAAGVGSGIRSIGFRMEEPRLQVAS
jgi:hypothetical protein